MPVIFHYWNPALKFGWGQAAPPPDSRVHDRGGTSPRKHIANTALSSVQTPNADLREMRVPIVIEWDQWHVTHWMQQINVSFPVMACLTGRLLCTSTLSLWMNMSCVCLWPVNWNRIPTMWMPQIHELELEPLHFALPKVVGADTTLLLGYISDLFRQRINNVLNFQR